MPHSLVPENESPELEAPLDAEPSSAQPTARPLYLPDTPHLDRLLKLVAQAPPLSAERRNRIAAILANT